MKPAKKDISLITTINSFRLIAGKINLNLTEIGYSAVEDALRGQKIQFGGYWSPTGCTPQHYVAVLVPYR
jgi:hypothetical protein